MIYRMNEWYSPAGYWYCNCVDDLAGSAGLWYTPARILGISPAAFVKLLVDNYKPDKITYNAEKNVLIYAWKSQSQMRKFKNAINAAARKVNYQI